MVLPAFDSGDFEPSLRKVPHPVLLRRGRRCQAPLSAAAGPDDPEPTWHQVAELPPRPVEITEYQRPART